MDELNNPDLPCRKNDPEIWFPLGDSKPGREQAALAKSFCATCPAIKACLNKALELRVEFGVWGGMDEFERKVVFRSRGLRRREPMVVGVWP